MPPDAVDAIVEQWRRERPDLDPTPMEVFGRVVRAGRLTEDRQLPTFARYGLTGPDFDLLATLRRTGAPFRLTPTVLRRTAMVSSGGMTKRIDRLERLGHVTRVPDPSDRRGVLVELTPAAVRLVDEVVVEHLANEERLLAPLAPDQRQQVVKALRLLLAALESGS
jgi:DNA-binding MarR family transcriptional regulator